MSSPIAHFRKGALFFFFFSIIASLWLVSKIFSVFQCDLALSCLCSYKRDRTRTVTVNKSNPLLHFGLRTCGVTRSCVLGQIPFFMCTQPLSDAIITLSFSSHCLWYSSSMPLWLVVSSLLSFSLSSLRLGYLDLPCSSDGPSGEILSVHRACDLELSSSLCETFFFSLFF